MFQFTLPRGERPGYLLCRATSTAVSIHAPARGATRVSLTWDSKEGTFQFTLPRGERRRRQVARSHPRGFNSRSREGSDGATDVLYLVAHVSIHAPARGATIRDTAFSKSITGFNSRSREGSDYTGESYLRSSTQFQFTLPRGERPVGKRALSIAVKFQFTLPRGERPR